MKPLSYFFILCALILVLPITAQAQKSQRAATSEQVALAFYRMGNAVPNWENWIKSTAPYNLTPWAHREKIFKQEQLRLQNAYAKFNPERHFLIVHTKVMMQPNKKIDEDGKESYHLPIKFKSAPEAEFFPYDFLTDRIIIVPYKLKGIMNDEIEKNEYDFLIKNNASGKEFTMVAQLRADEANIEKPLVINKVNNWALYTDIVSMSIWNNDGILLWEHSAPWYVSKTKRDINQLYIKRTIETRPPRVLKLPDSLGSLKD